MVHIKNIIFDLGGVLLDIDYTLTTKAFQDLGFPAFENMYSQQRADELFQKLETGNISANDFYEVLASSHAGDVTRAQLEFAWNSMLLGWRAESLEFLKTLSEEYRIFLLSNSNVIHVECITTMLKKETRLESIDGLFSGAWYSHLIGLRKPDEAAFEFALREGKMAAAETLFIDDSENNIAKAAAMGLKVHHFQKEERIENLDYTRFSL